MPRKPRQESSTGFYHVIMRGNNKKYIYEEKAHKLDFLEALFQQEKLGMIELAAWCVMDNHVHVILKAELADLSKAFKDINQTFANKYNTGTRSVGHVYDNRFMSMPIESDLYLIQSVRYVHNNPVRAGMVKKPEDYSWSSYGVFEKYPDRLTRPQMAFVMRYFQDDFSRFAIWHFDDDEAIHFDVKEDLEAFYLNRAARIIQKYAAKYGLQTREDFMVRREVTDRLIVELHDCCHLPWRKIAGILELTYARVQGARRGDLSIVIRDDEKLIEQG